MAITPQRLKLVIIAVLGVKNMDHNLNKIDKYPLALVVTSLTKPPEPFFFGVFVDMVGYGPALPVAGACGDNKEICCGAFAPEIYYLHIAAVVGKCDLCDPHRKLFSGSILFIRQSRQAFRNMMITKT